MLPCLSFMATYRRPFPLHPGNNAPCSPTLFILTLVIVTTISVTCIEFARFRPFLRPHPAKIHFGGDGIVVFGGGGQSGKGRAIPKVPTSEKQHVGSPAGARKKLAKHREVDNAGLDDFWAVGFGDAETELEGEDALFVGNPERFRGRVNKKIAPQMFGVFRDRWEGLVGAPVVETIEGRSVFWQVPPTGPTKVILLVQGRNEQADTWWLQSKNCSHCSGPPPSVAITEAALRHGYAVVSIDNGRWSRDIPYNEKEITWDNRWPLRKNRDVTAVKAILERWRTREGLSALPLQCLGFSGGGRFCSMLSHVAPINGQALYGSPGNGKALAERRRADGSMYPPTLFVHMPRHHELNAQVAHSLDVLTSRNVTVGLLELYPVRVTADWLRHNMRRLLTRDEISKLHESLKTQQWLDSDHFLECPNALLRKPGYEKLFKAAGLVVPYDVANHLQRLLRQAYALHDVSSERVSEVLDWLGDECQLSNTMRTGARCTEVINETPKKADTLVFKHEPPC